jgi:internalin A
MRLAGSFLLVLFSHVLLGQSPAEKLQQEEQKDREALLRKREAMIKAFESNPERYRDSVRMVRFRASQAEAQKRIARYASNGRKDTVRVLDLSFGDLSEIPAFVYEHSSLERLILENNRITKLPGKLRKLKRLSDVRLNENTGDGKLKIGWGLPVEHLEVTTGALTKVPAIKRMKDLKYLDLSGNSLTTFPLNQLKASKNLREVLLKENPLGALDEMRFDKWEAVEILKMNKCEISDIDPSFYRVPNLKELQLQENPLNVLPEGISQMQSLEKLSFYKCQLDRLPDDFFNIPKLVIADLYYNELKSLPKSLGNAENIEVLFLSHNQLIEVPEEIGELSTLTQLYLHNNKISYLPESLARLTELRVLRVNNNLLMQFPSQITFLTELTDLDVDNNLIEKVPDAIGNLQKLNLFTFDGNPINFNDPSNKSFMEQVSEMEKNGTICKPSITMNYLNQAGERVDM